MRSSSGPLILFRYLFRTPSAHTQSFCGWFKKPQGQGFVAYLHFVVLRAKRPKNPAYPAELKTIRDHIRMVRLDRQLTQKQVSTFLGVTADTVTNWELNRNYPRQRYYQSIYEFLGYVPSMS